MRGADFILENHGSIFVLQPLTGAANEWAAENLPEDAIEWAGGVVIEPRYVEEIVIGIRNDGLIVK